MDGQQTQGAFGVTGRGSAPWRARGGIDLPAGVAADRIGPETFRGKWLVVEIGSGRGSRAAGELRKRQAQLERLVRCA
ncbi:MAG: hypothetical protein AB7N76_11145 [Planctomycetota bacterium]